uniref:Uncharacterized protein n=1 Tax=Fagus sylvatica TaxID=28930 RepID=A0A2N9H9D5_FAGSY
MSDFNDLGIVGKLALPNFQRYKPCNRGELGFARYGLANRGRRNVPYAKGFDHNSLVSRPFLAHKVSNRSSHHVLQNGQGAFSSIQLSVWSTVRSNLGQTLVKLSQPWSNLVKLGQNSPNPGKCILGRVSRIFGHSGPQLGQKRLGQTSVKLGQLRSNLVNLGQTWSDLGKCVPDPVLRLFGVMSPRRNRPTWFGLPRFCVLTPEKIPGFRQFRILDPNTLSRDNLRLQICCKSSGPTAWNLSPNTLRGDLTWGLPKLQIEFEPTIWNLSPNTLRGDLTWRLPKLQIGWFNGLESQSKQVEGCKSGGSTVWNLSPNRLRSDLTWGLPKLQIGWFNGLESQSKQVEGCKSGGSTIWNLSPNRLRSDLTWGLPKLQIRWFNGLESQSKQVEGCKSGGSTVWNLSPNRLRSDLTWGLPKLQIGWFNGLESQSKQVEGLRGDLTWGLPKLQIGWFNGLESQSKQMSHRGSGSGDRRRSSRPGFLCHASSIEVVVALSVGSECTRIPYFRLSYLVDSPARHFWVIFVFLDFRVELGFQGRSLTFQLGSRFSGYSNGGRSILFTLHRMLPFEASFGSAFDLWAGSRALGRSPAADPKSSITEPPKTFS